MPVIGRLDQQVSDVLIEPLCKNRTRDEHDAPATADDATADATGEASPRDEDRRHDDEPLPVWLL
jgi:hypothetical protein